MKHQLKRKAFAAIAAALTIVLVIATFAVFAQEPAPSVWDGSVATAFAGGDGSTENPYQIANAAQLAYLASLVNNGAEFIATDDGKAESVSQGSVIMYTKGSKVYYLSAYNGTQYLSVSDNSTSYTLTEAAEAITYYTFTINNVRYFTKENPTAVDAQAYSYDETTCQLTALDGVEIGYRKFKSTDDEKYKTHYFVVGNYDKSQTDHTVIDTTTYTGSMTTLKGHAVTFVNDAGVTETKVFYDNATFFTVSESILLTAVKDDVLFGWFPTDSQRASAVATTDGNGNKVMTYGEELLETTAYASLSYILTADIALNDVVDYDKWNDKANAPDNTWTPIGNRDYVPFTGTFDGDGHTISGLYFRRENVVDTYSGLFGSVRGATVKDVTLSKGYVQAGLVLGALIGRAVDSDISGIQNEGVYVKAYKGRSGWYHATQQPYGGGIVGEARNGTVIVDCHNSATVYGHNYSNSSGDGTLDIYTGGIVGYAAGLEGDYVRITSCTNSGAIYSLNDHDHRTQYTGGIAGSSKYVDIAGCIVSGAINAHAPGVAHIGGIVGSASQSNVVSNICSSHIDTFAILALDLASNNRSNTANGGIVGTAASVYIANNIFCGTQYTEFEDSGCAARTGMLAGNADNASTVSYNYYIPDTQNTNTIGVHGTVSTPKNAENFAITAEHLTGAAAAVINASGTYANTANLVSAMNSFVLAYNGYGVTLTQGQATPIPYKTYYSIQEISVVGAENGVCTIKNVVPDMFPAGITTTGYKVGDTIAFAVNANDGYVIRKVEYGYGKDTFDLQPNADGNYEFVMPDAAVTITLHFVETGADVYSITYLGCDEVSKWSAYQIKAHFKGYDTVIPTPTRPNHDFAGWLVNGSTTPVMSLTLGGNDYSANITIEATWTPKTLVQISLDAQAPFYNGAQNPFLLIGADKDMPGITVKYLIGEKWISAAPVNAGVYSVHVFRAEDDIYQSVDKICTLTIRRAASSLVIKNDISKEYNNAVAENPEITSVGDGEITYHFFNSENVEIAVPKNVGTYKVTVRMAQGQNYEATEVSATFTITKATLDTSVFSWSYNEPFTYSNAEQTVYIIGLPSDIEVVYGGVCTAKNAGTYTASATFIFDEHNYNPVTIDALEWTIARKNLGDLDLSWVYHADFVYDGTVKEVTISGLPEDVTVNAYTSNFAINAGTYTASATFVYDSANYESVSITPLVWEIAKAKMDTSTIKWTNTTLTFNGQVQSVSVTGLPEGVSVLYSGNQYVVAGEYFATAVFFMDEENYEHIRSMTVAWSIEKAEPIIGVDIVNKILYDGQAHVPAATLNHTEAQLAYDLQAQTLPGIYWYTVSVPETYNFKAAQVNVKLIITQTDDELIARANEENNNARNARTMTAMYEALSRAHGYLALVENKDAQAFKDSYNQLMLTVNSYNGSVNDVTKDMAGVFKAVIAPVYKLIPKDIVKELLDFILEKLEN